MGSVLATKTAVFVELEFVGRVFLVFRGGIVPLLTLCASQGDDITHGVFLKTSPRPVAVERFPF
jgi:hypothetical protein